MLTFSDPCALYIQGKHTSDFPMPTSQTQSELSCFACVWTVSSIDILRIENDYRRGSIEHVLIGGF